MIQSLTRRVIFFITVITFFISVLNAQKSSVIDQAKPYHKHVQKMNIDESRNRFPAILQDVKILLSDVLIADHHLDTLEVIYNLSRVYDLLMEADQIGDMNQEDQEEY